MKNSANFGVALGRITKDLKTYTNSDGSTKILFTVAARSDFKNKTTGEYDVEYVPFEGYVPAGRNNLSVYEHMKKGTPVSVTYHVHTAMVDDKKGGKVFKIVLAVDHINLLPTNKA